MSIALPTDISKWIILAIVIVAIVLVTKVGARLISILITALVLGFCWYTFFTEEGATRLSIALSGHPLIAYTTSLDKQEDISTEDTVYFKSSKDVIIGGTKQEYVQCHTKWIIRIPYVGY